MRKRILVAFYMLFFFLLSNGITAQNLSLRFESLTIDDGLSQSKISYIMQDRLGFMWFGTQDGLNMYNGYDFKIFRNERSSTSISGNYVLSMCEDKHGYIWVGTMNGGINRFDHSTGNFISYRFDSLNVNLNKNFANCITETRNGALWVGTSEGGLNLFDRELKKFTAYKNIPTNSNSISNDNITSIKEDEYGRLWVGTRNGLNLYDPVNDAFKRFKANPKDPFSLSSNTINYILIDHSGKLWVATPNGLNLYDSNKEQFKKYFHNPNNPSSVSTNNITYLYEDRYNRLWIGTEVGLNLFNQVNENFTRYYHDAQNPKSLNENHILSLCEDRSGTMWIGTLASGLNWFETISKGFVSYRNIPDDPASLSNNIIRCFYEDSEEMGLAVWIGTDGGLNFFNRKNNKFTVFKHNPTDLSSISSNRVNAILKDRYGILWFGTDNGLDRYDYSKKSFIHFKHNPHIKGSISDNLIVKLYEDPHGVLWVGTRNGGLNRYDRVNNQFISYQRHEGDPGSLSNNLVRAIIVDHTGTYWIGTSNGLNIFDTIKNEFIHFYNNPKDTSSISSNRILSIYEDKDNGLWVATVQGINYYDRYNNKFTRYSQKNGLPNDVTYSSVEDNSGNLWISTNKGISRFNLKTRRIKNFDVTDGLQGNEFNYGAYYKNKRGEMFFGGINGFTIFHPDSIKINLYKPSIVFTDLKILNKSVSNGEKVNGRIILTKSINETKKIELSYKDNVITIEFAALHYVSSKKNQYAYILEGLEDKWNHVGNRRFATYSTLPPGEYTFRVKASNSDGVWNEKGIAIKIIVLPPFWKTWWFRSLILLFIGGSAYLWYRNKISTMKKQKETLETQVMERTAEILEKNIKLEKLSIVASETDNAVIIMDENFNFEWINEGFTKLYGFTFNDYVLKRGGNLIKVSNFERIVELTNQCIESKKSVHYETKMTTKDEGNLWVQTTLTPIFDDAGNIKKFVAIDADITELKEAEMVIKAYNEEIRTQNEELASQHEAIEKQNKELESHRNHLEKLVDEKTKELKAALYKAEESDRLKTAFLTNMSHEIRTPMNAIIGFSEILMRTNKDETQKEYLNSIKLSGRTLLSLINDILDLSRIEAGRMTIKKDIINIKNIFFELEQIFGTDAELKGLSLFTEVSNNFPEFIELDELRIRQVLINLINNAIKFTQEGYIRIKADARIIQKRIKLIISVQDTGIGIKESEQEKIFDAFNQSDLNDARNYGGTGLGLAIVSRIVPLFNGTIKIKSKVGKGTTFIVELPDIKVHTERLVLLPKEDINPDCITFEEGTILIVDDKKINIRVIKGLLKQYNFKLIEAYNGIEAIDIALLKIPDLILMDLKMPEMNGYKATKFLKSNEKTRHIPVVVLTASVLGFNENLLDEYEFSGYLPKPVEINQLVLELSKFLPHEIISDSSQNNITNSEINFLKENNELKKYLEVNVLNVWKQLQLSRTSILEREFASQIIKAGQIYQNEYLEEIGKSLELATKTFNIEKGIAIQDELYIIFNKLMKDKKV